VRECAVAASVQLLSGMPSTTERGRDTLRSLYSAEEAVESWGAGPQLEALKTHSAATVLHNVDATQLHCSSLAQQQRFE
jgi:hypothetical protein